MKKLFKLIIIFGIWLLLFGFTLLSVWSVSIASEGNQGSRSTSAQSVHLTARGTITFTPVATLYLPVVTRAEEVPASGPTDIRITLIEYNPDGLDADGEYVDIQNFGEADVDMTNWRLSDAVSTTFTFPAFNIASQATVRVWVRDGSNDMANLYWGRKSATWNNTGDTAVLKNAAGAEVDRCVYPDEAISDNGMQAVCE